MRRPTLPAAMAAVAIAFALVLGFGFWIHERTDAIPDTLFGFFAAIAIVAIAGTIFCLISGISIWQPLQRPIAALGSKPNRPPDSMQERTAIRMSWAQTVYQENLEATAACVHLQPVERAMRLAGLDVRLQEISEYAPVVRAACRVDEATLRRVFDLPAFVYYKEGYEPERSPWDNPRADIICGECLQSDRSRCDILVLHPDECRDHTPWFPGPP